jgi:hypothetical protein
MKTNFVKKNFKKSPPLCVGIFGIFGFYSLPIRRAAFPDFIQSGKGPAYSSYILYPWVTGSACCLLLLPAA